jgi:xylulokinase
MFLGIDIGTSSVKAVVINDTGDVIDQAAAPLSVSRPEALWSEQAPADWWAATQKAVLELSPDRRANVRGIGLSGQMHGATLLGQDNSVLRPAILWNDGRSFRQCQELEAREPRLHAISGNLAMPGFTAPKLIWVQENEPEIFGKIARVLLPKDYVRLLMTGEAASDMSDSAGTLWLDVAKRAWSPELLAATGLSEAQMPKLYEGSEITGHLKAEIARAWGMGPVPVVGGGGDNAAGAVGVGVIGTGDAFLSLGTSGVLFLSGEKFLPNPAEAVHAFCHALPGRWHQMTVMLSAASCIDWAARLTGVHDAGELIALAEKRGRIAGPEVFLPYLSGERTPHNDPHARGLLMGLDHDSDAAAIGQAVLEGVAFAFADGMDALEAGGGKVGDINVIGGGARSAYWGRILAGALGRRLVYRRDSAVGPAYGAAKLALLGVTGANAEEVCSPPPILFSIDPKPEDVERLARARARFRHAYTQIKPLFTMESRS